MIDLKNQEIPKEKEKGLYVLVLRLDKKQKITAGKLGQAAFDPGIYIYTGRAKNGFWRRIRRHLRKEKRPFWHIDYLIEKAKIEEVWLRADFFDECRIASEVRRHLAKSTYPLKKFGSSDCRCPGHLLFIPDEAEDLWRLREKIQFRKIDFERIQV